MCTSDEQLKGKKKIQQKCLWENNPRNTLLRIFSEPVGMFIFGVMVSLRVNSAIKSILGEGYSLIGSFFSWVIEYLPAQVKDTILEGVDSKPADLAINGVQHKLFSLLHLPKYHFPLYFFLVTFGALLTYFILFFLFQMCYKKDKTKSLMAINMVAYRNRRMLIPLYIGAVVTRVSFIVGIIAFFVAFIMGIVAVFDAFEVIHPRDKKNGWFAFLSLIVVAAVRIFLYNFLFFMVLPAIF